ncbi:MAG: stage V sporulation protein AE [Defluviitaleaceae bacterium]|nr:stage V sporulation protein AE [Defluviitaleaceae bacterium]MCL2273722.1 stage V sporulation protein AE [Defluviitaleaceae bacterium]
MTLFWAFIIGGLICVIGQLLIDLTKLTPARILVIFVVAGCFLSGIGVYQHIVDFAGAGALVPLPGFGHVLAQGTKKAVNERGLLGVVTGGFTAMAGGVTVAVVVGYLIAMVSKPKGDAR